MVNTTSKRSSNWKDTATIVNTNKKQCNSEETVANIQNIQFKTSVVQNTLSAQTTTIIRNLYTHK